MAKEKVEPEVEVSFEQAVQQLESIVTSLEEGSLGLEESLKAYEQGLGLAKTCLSRLDQAELRVQQLAEGATSVADADD